MINAIFILYLIFIIYLGFRSLRYTKTQEDYFLAGRNLGPWVTAFSERASGESAWLLLALPGAVIVMGLVELWTVAGIIIGIILSWFLIAEKLRLETQKYNAITIPQYLHRRYKDDSNIILLFSSIIISFFFLFYVSAQFHASGKVLKSLFGLDPVLGITIGGVIIISYTLLGGFYAVAWTDLIQGVLMIGTLIILPIAGFIELSETKKTISDTLESASVVFNNNNNSFFNGNSGLAAILSSISGLSWGLGYLGQPHLLIRYMAINSSRSIKKAKIIAVLWAIPGITGAFFIGIVSLMHFGPEYFYMNDSEQAMPLLAIEILHPVIAGIFISGAVAAMMSTADSQLLVSASAITEDFYHQYLGRNLKEDSLVKLSRMVIVILGLIAYCIAIVSEIQDKRIFAVVSYAWSGLGSSFGPALLLTLWWKKTTRLGVILGLITGFTSTIIWGNSEFLKSIMSERLVSFFISISFIYLVSIFKKNENKRSNK
ncbi:MAG: sodium/proline symporter [Candidatus Neomarinimicrobiota bacterium]